MDALVMLGHPDSFLGFSERRSSSGTAHITLEIAGGTIGSGMPKLGQAQGEPKPNSQLFTVPEPDAPGRPSHAADRNAKDTMGRPSVSSVPK